ncbi:MAG: STAS domain-containing protein [Leptospiraceae bacterium]|nr:STAS domain-containing protein [Leptospiraceae bacterium]MCP5510437.1 STAS domain-containing protein [Leptospiraceae bacterium]
MKIILGKDCTIRQLESKKDRLGKALTGPKGKISIEISKLEKIDTAFLQALLAVIKTCEKNGKKWEIKGRSAAFESILACYGITL